MTETPSIYEKTFAKSNKTDAILVVDGKKLHVNKALLSYHSSYFRTLLKSTPGADEFQIDDVIFEDFATLLSFIQTNPLSPTKENAENVLELADRFQLQGTKCHVEMFLQNSNLAGIEKMRIGEKHGLYDLVCTGFLLYPMRDVVWTEQFQNFSDETKAKLLHHAMNIHLC